MNIDDFLKKAKETAIYPNQGNNFEYTLLGLLGECGELANHWKKKIRDDGELTEERLELLKSELSDIAWYFVMCCDELKVKPSEILYKNIQKLTKRKEDGVLKGSGDAR